MKNNKLLTVGMCVMLSFLLGGCSLQAGAKTIKGEELNKIEKDDKDKEKYLVIDVRDVKDYNEGHLKHAINIPITDIDKSIEEIRIWREKKVVVYSDSTDKTKEAVQKLTNQGFKEVLSAENLKEFKYDLVKFTSLGSAKFQDVLLNTKIDKVILDARDKKDYDEKHAAGAKNVDSKNLDNLKDILPEDKSTPIYTYCYSGNRSSVVAQKLIDLGYKNVFNALDGTKEFNYKFEVADCCVEHNENHNHKGHDHSKHEQKNQKSENNNPEHEGHNH